MGLVSRLKIFVGMKKARFIATLLFLFTGALPLRGEEAPRIVFESPDYDFGRAYQGEKVIHTYQFRNRGGSDLIIEKVRSSCGCTTALISAKTVLPGESGEIKATFSTRGRRGRQRKTITVISNDPENSAARLTISGEIVAPLNLVPARLHLHEITFGKGKSEDVKVELSKDCDIRRITEVHSTSPHITAEVEDTEFSGKRGGLLSFIPRLFGGGKEKVLETVLHVRVIPGAPKGRLSGRVTLRYENGKKGEATLQVYGRVVGNIAARPARLSLGSIYPGAGKEKSIVVTDKRGRKLVINRTETGSEFLEVALEPVDVSSVRCLVKVKPGAPPGVIRGRLKLFTDDAAEGVVEVPYAGRVMIQNRTPGND